MALRLLVELKLTPPPATASFPSLEVVFPKKYSRKCKRRRAQPAFLTPSRTHKQPHLVPLQYSEISTNKPPLFDLLVISKFLELSLKKFFFFLKSQWLNLEKHAIIQSKPKRPIRIEPWKITPAFSNGKRIKPATIKNQRKSFWIYPKNMWFPLNHLRFRKRLGSEG